jgi:sugar diacid utilization regulator
MGEELQVIEHLRGMQRGATRPDGLHRLVRQTVGWLGGQGMLVDGTGETLYAYPDEQPDTVAGDEIRREVARQCAASVDIGDQVVTVFPIGEPGSPGALVLIRDRPLSAQDQRLMADVTRLLSLCWRVESAARRMEQVDAAESRVRETVLHLLMTGHTTDGRQAAVALGPPLPGRLRVYVVECPAQSRRETATQCADACEGPVYRQHLIVLMPASGSTPARLDEMLRDWLGRNDSCYVGVSLPMTLAEIAVAYEQAFHALAMARNLSDRYARFTPSGALSALVGPRGYGWATGTLAPLLAYRPNRKQDPDAQEMIVTLTAWLSFHSAATAFLRIHRNTLTGRLRLIEQLLGRELAGVRTQAETQLALQLLDHADGSGETASLDDLLGTPQVRRWAETQLARLRHDGEVSLSTVRTWLDNDARIEPTARALGLSAPGTRKRLERLEGVLGRSLLNGPSARHDLYFAFRAVR